MPVSHTELFHDASEHNVYGDRFIAVSIIITLWTRRLEYLGSMAGGGGISLFVKICAWAFPTPYPVGTAAFSAEVKRSALEADSSFPFSAVFMNAWS